MTLMLVWFICLIVSMVIVGAFQSAYYGPETFIFLSVLLSIALLYIVKLCYERGNEGHE